MEAAAGGLAEVQLGRLASQKALRSEVKEFAQMMVTDHTRANDQLMKMAQSKGVTTPPSLKPDHKAAQDHLSKLSGEAFDRAYIQHMVKDHQKDVALFRKQSTGASDAEVKQFASATLPTLQKHLARAQEIEEIVGATSGSTRGTSGSSPGAGSDQTKPPAGSSGTGSGSGSGSGSGADSGSGSGAGGGATTPPR
jgi:putative membrane protein